MATSKKVNLVEAKKKLSPEQYNVCFLGATEMPGSGKYLHNKAHGKYKCVVCGQELFSSDTKYDSQTGWPAFWDMSQKGVIKTDEDNSWGMSRTLVSCSNCGSHLGHVFEDGPRDKTGLRYCINSLALEFVESDKK